jgi:glycosyltransferase involved in cell wall biosynthesis
VRVALVTSIERGGPIEQALLLSRGLARAGASVLVTCANAELAERFASDGVRAEVAPLRHQTDARGAASVWKLAHGADVIHAHDRRAGLWSLIGPRPSRNGIRVYTVHGVPAPYYPPPVGPESPGLRARLLYGGLEATLCRRADAIIVPSRTVAEDLVNRVRFPRRRITVVPNGIEHLPSESDRGELIGTLSLLDPVKAIDVFLRAALQLGKRHPSWRFVCYGSGPEAPRLQALARDLGLSELVDWPGFIPTADALATLGVYVICSYSETAPLALLEAMGRGVPVVATAVGGIPEIADESVARMIPAGDPQALADAIELACTDTTESARRTHAARARVEERFTAERNARTISQLYERLISARGPSRPPGRR